VLVGDKLGLNQVFLNLINNAINILQEGERIIDNGPWWKNLDGEQ
jgi:signal transduction histidine kinase